MKFKGRVETKVDKSGVGKKSNEPFTSFQYHVIETEGQYPQEAVLDIFGDKLEQLNVGDVAEFDFNMRVSKYESKIFGSNSVWKISVLGKATAATAVDEEDDTPF